MLQVTRILNDKYYKADVNSKEIDSHLTALHLAAVADDVRIAKLLVFSQSNGMILSNILQCVQENPYLIVHMLW